LFRVGFSIADTFETGKLEGEVIGRVWMPCIGMAMTVAEPDRQDLRVGSLTADDISALLGFDFETRTRELSALARDMSESEREVFFEEQMKECFGAVVE